MSRVTGASAARLALLPIAAFLLSACGLQEGLAQRSESAATPAQAPAISGVTLAGRPLSWSSVHGHAVVLDFWASWCGPCRAEQADLNRLFREYGGRGVVFLGIDLRDDNASALSYTRDLSVAYASIADSAEQISAAYDVSAPPTIVVVDQHGAIASRFLGTVVGVSDALNRVL